MNKILTIFVIFAIVAGCAQHPVTISSDDRNSKEFPYFDTELIKTDFSFAGMNYSENGVDYRNDTIFHVSDFGALPGDEQDDTDAIRRAISAAEENDGGIVQFDKGVFLVNEDPNSGQILIQSSNIVLRGDASGKTQIYMTNHMPARVPHQKWTGPAMFEFHAPNFRQSSLTTSLKIPARKGDLGLHVLNASEFKSGGFLEISVTSLNANPVFLKGQPTRSNWERINTEGVSVLEYYEITNVADNYIELAKPLLTDLSLGLPWEVRPVELLTHVGFENIHFKTSFEDPFVHHKSARQNSGFRGVMLKNTAHSWVKNCIFENVSNAVTLNRGVANSVLLNVVTGNAGHFSFGSEFSTRNLIGLNLDVTNSGQWHGPGASHMASGNVIWRYESPRGRGIDSHARFPRLTLFDNVTMRGFGGWGGSHLNLPHHLDGLTIWNFTQKGARVGDHHEGLTDFWRLPKDPKQKQGFMSAVYPVMVGYQGELGKVNHENFGLFESYGQNVLPKSLFEAQLKARLGDTPDWLASALVDWQLLRSNYDLNP